MKLVKKYLIDIMIKNDGGKLLVFDNINMSYLFKFLMVVFKLKNGEYMIFVVKISNGYEIIWMIKNFGKGKMFDYIVDLKK